MKDFQHSTMYHIYLRSFQDSNGDGIGDLKGLIRRLTYLKRLGVQYIWITPFYISPQKDNGYDVADYCSIDPVYGTMDDFHCLVEEAAKMDMGIILDMVFNHTSTEHEWFQKALKGDLTYKDYYIWQAPGPDGSPPTNWVSKFGGNAWEYVPEFDQYYLHLFDKTQADLNWENPRVRESLRNVLSFWMQKGVKGFRFDVVNLIAKPPIFMNDSVGDGRGYYTDGEKVHDYLKELCTHIHEAGLVTVGEMSSTSIESCIQYSHPKERELSMCFNFHHLKVDYLEGEKWALQEFDFMKLKQLLNEWQTGMQEGGGWNALFWSNHDQPRILSRFGDDKDYPTQSAKMLAAVLYLMRGTPYIYQGEEIGMTNAYFSDISQYMDVETLNYYQILQSQGVSQEEIIRILQHRSRDNARTPMQWDNSAQAGFTEGTPWLEINANYQHIHVEKSLEDSDSVFYWYQKLIQMRKEMDVIAYGEYVPWLEEHPQVFAYKRTFKHTKLLVLANFYGEVTQVLPYIAQNDDYKCILYNYQSKPLSEKMVLEPYETLVYLKQ